MPALRTHRQAPKPPRVHDDDPRRDGDLRKVSLWLGHSDSKTTEVYVRADVSEKLAIAGAVVPPSLRRGRFRVPDALIPSLRAPMTVRLVREGARSRREPSPSHVRCALTSPVSGLP
jgi:hypothetical protein